MSVLASCRDICGDLNKHAVTVRARDWRCSTTAARGARPLRSPLRTRYQRRDRLVTARDGPSTVKVSVACEVASSPSQTRGVAHPA
jgi:hypothetical protein